MEIILAFICMVCIGCFYCYPLCKGEKSFHFTKLKLYPTHSGFQTGRPNCWLCRPLLAQSIICFRLDIQLNRQLSAHKHQQNGTTVCVAQVISAVEIAKLSAHHTSITVSPEMLGKLQQKAFRWYLYNPISSFQCSIFASWAVFQDMFDKDPSHDFSVTQAASHTSPSNNADPQ